MTKLYLDIDGVLLAKEHQAPQGIVEFLEFATTHFDCFWLTTHCQGDTRMPFLYLVGKLPQEALPFLEKIKPTNWNLLKTEGIDFDHDFFWLEDFPFEAEKKILEEHGALEKLILINLEENPNQLIDLTRTVKP